MHRMLCEFLFRCCFHVSLGYVFCVICVLYQISVKHLLY
jgi:hypothetical protein